MTAPWRSVEWASPIPDDVQWPDDQTLVLTNRELVPGTDVAALSRFGDDHWSLTAAVFEEHVYTLTLNFSSIPERLRLASKHYFWQLINHSRPPRFTRRRRARQRSLPWSVPGPASRPS